MRARMALRVSDVAYEHREVLLRDKPSAMLAASPKGTVPVFITDKGTVIDESLDLMRWALAQNDPHNWLEGDNHDAGALIETNDGPFKHNLDRYKYASRYNQDAARGDVDLSHRKSAESFIQRLEDKLADSDYLLGNKQSLADIAIFPFIRQFANTDRDWWKTSAYQKTGAWLERHTSSSLFLGIMTKHPIWVDISQEDLSPSPAA